MVDGQNQAMLLVERQQYARLWIRYLTRLNSAQSINIVMPTNSATNTKTYRYDHHPKSEFVHVTLFTYLQRF